MRSPEERATAAAIIALMRGVVYRETNEDAWAALGRHGAAVRDHFASIGVEVVVDDAEGYAYVRSQEPDDGEDPLPRLVRRRTLSYHVSLLLVLLRKRLVEFETSSADSKLVISRDQMVEMLRLFLPDATNEARVISRIDGTINKAVDAGFLREMHGQPGQFEVRRILKAYVDAQTLSDFAGKLAEYAEYAGADGE